MSAIIHRFNGSTDESEQSSTAKLKPFIKKIEGCLNTTLTELINRMFDCADDMLFQLADNAETNEDQNKYFDTMRMLRVERKIIAQNFISHLSVYLDTHNKKSANNELCEDELSLIDQDEMEEMVAVAAMHSKAVSLYNESISHLDARIEFLLLKSKNAFNKDALSPKNICESFKDALANIDLSTNNKLIIYKLFDQEVILKLDALYKHLNQIFIDHGILPQIKIGYARNTNSIKQKDQMTPPETLETDALYKENITYNTNRPHTFSNQTHTGSGTYASSHEPFNAADVIHQFLSGKRYATGANIPTSFSVVGSSHQENGTKYYNRRDVMSALSNLQKNAAQSQYFYEPVNVAEFKRELFENIASQQGGGAITRQVSQVDEKTIDFVEMLFEAITKDSSISEHITTLLLKLQIPVIKVAFLDNQFFSNNQHPCRSTLNLIAYLGKGISSKKDNLFIQLNKVVEDILNDFNVDISSFQKAQDVLEKIELNELHKTAEKEKITQIIALQSHAREVILNELQYHLKNKILPEVAKKLILKNWSTLMFHCYIKQGKNSDEWRDHVSTINKLILILQPIESSYAYNQLDTEKNTLLNKIHDQLLLTKQNPLEIEVEINSILNHLEEALSKSKFNAKNKESANSYYANINANKNIDKPSSYNDMPEPTLEIEDNIPDPLHEQSIIASKKISDLPDTVRPGVWFKVHNPDSSNSRRAKLSVIIIEEAKLIFVDRLGAKVIEKDAEIFSRELNEGNSEIIADHSAFDHALASVINSLSAAI